jgi:YesN/AraC family two-component response regulator
VADIMMPVMDGIEMSRLIRRNVATSTIPIILLTAKDNEHTETDAYKIGVDVFLSKPFDINHLITRINQLVRNKTKLTEQLRNTEAMQIKEVEVVQSQDEKFLTTITQTIEEYLEDPDLNIQKLAEISGYHHKLIYRRIKALTGNTTVDYIKSIRLKKAAMLLAQKKFSVAEVMYMVGFSTHSYFSKCFTEKYGKSPKAYMDEVNN